MVKQNLFLLEFSSLSQKNVVLQDTAVIMVAKIISSRSAKTDSLYDVSSTVGYYVSFQGAKQFQHLLKHAKAISRCSAIFQNKKEQSGRGHW